MTERKPSNESWESFSERKIREAMDAGAFANLPGFGRPIPGIDRPLDENWWIRDKLKRENVVVLPPILQVRKEIEETLAAIRHEASEARIRQRLERLNTKIRVAHYSPLAGPADGVAPIDVERIVSEWKQQRAAMHADSRPPGLPASAEGAD